MTLPTGFLFSQSSLQDYVDCQRRFQLRYIQHLSWPSVEAEPVVDYERMLEQGSRLHKVIYQHLVGVPEAQIESSIHNDEILSIWWQNYLNAVMDGNLNLILNARNENFEEITLSTPILEFRLVAKYDLLVVKPDHSCIILDWKTSQNHPKHKWLADRPQTHVYPYVLVNAGKAIFPDGKLNPEQVEMIYWFTNQPGTPESFSYNRDALNADGTYLTHLISTIAQKTEKVFPLTPDVKRCLFCTYRSLCNRGVKPGDLQHLEEWEEAEPASENLNLDYDQISEIEF